MKKLTREEVAAKWLKRAVQNSLYQYVDTYVNDYAVEMLRELDAVRPKLGRTP